MSKSILHLTIEDQRPPSQSNCSYCGAEHQITQCDVYEFHNDPGAEVDAEWIAGRDMVLARRKTKHFGGIPEMYLKSPTPEQSALAHAYLAEQSRKRRFIISEGLKHGPNL